MKQRNPIAVFLLPFITFGIYSIYWQVKTKLEMNRVGATIPTAWLLIIPLVNIWWLWKYSEGVEKVTGNKLSTVISFILLFILGSIGQAVIQDSLNKVANEPVVAAPTAAPSFAATPTASDTTGPQPPTTTEPAAPAPEPPAATPPENPGA